MFNGYININDHTSATECGEKLLILLHDCGASHIEGAMSFQMAKLYQSQTRFEKAEKLFVKALKLAVATGQRNLEGGCYEKLGTLFYYVREYRKAEEYTQRALEIYEEIGDKNGKAQSYGNLGAVFQSLGEYVKAEKYLEKALKITIEIGNKQGEGTCNGNLGAVLQSLGQYVTAEEYHKKALKIRNETGDKQGEAADYANLGNMYRALGQYVKAEENLQRALKIRKEIGDHYGEAADYGSLGTVFQSIGEYVKADEYHNKALKIRKDIGDKNGKAADYGNLGAVFRSLGEYDKAEEYLRKALTIRKQIGDKTGEASDYANLGIVFISLGEYVKAEEYLQKALKIRKEIVDKWGEASDYSNLGTVFQYLDQYSKAKVYHEKALELSYKIGCTELQFESHLGLAVDSLLLGRENINEAMLSLLKSIQKCEEMRVFPRDKDQFKISFFDEHVSPYQLLSVLYCSEGKPADALYVVELGRARALADKMSAQYSVKQEISVNPYSWAGSEKIMKAGSNSVCLYIAYEGPRLFLWIVKSDKAILFRQIDVNDCYSNKEAERMVDGVFDDKALRRFHILPEEQCEDRALFPSDINCLKWEISQEDCQAPSRLVEEDEEDEQVPPSLSQCYKMIIAPVADLLDKPEVIIVPDRVLYNVPFAALEDENEKPLSETFRIRIAPSLTTLKLIQDSPADYHSKTGALIVGDPEVGHVTYKGRLEWLCPLDFARKEAEMIGRLLGTQPLIGETATKQKVLENIHSVSLIHFAAHGNAERGEIALAPSFPTNGYPTEEDYLLTMAEISLVRLTAKLVVLSCCHSARGQIRSEGVVGIARAFLGSGARSVLVALWAIQDEATEQFMSRFYEHLVGGESASESLHQAMKWMRVNGFSDVAQWAPFMLIGDNVTFDFGK